MIQNYTFILNDQEFLLPANIDSIEGLPRDIINQILQNCRYEFEMDVEGEVFQMYLNHLVNRNIFPEINVQNVFQFHLLSDHFNILSDFLSQPELIELYKIAVLLNATSATTQNKAISEKYISENLDYYLANHHREIIQIPINSLYNIYIGTI